MRLIDRLVLKDLIGPFLSGMMMFLLLVFTAGFLFKATDMVVQGVPPLLVGKFILFALPSLVTQTFPMAMLLAALMAFGRLSSDREIVAIFAAGISFGRAARPVLIMGAIVSLMAFAWDETVVPPATRAMWDLQQDAVKQIARSDQPLAYNVEKKNSKAIEETVKVDGGYDAHTQTLRDVTIVKYSDDPSRGGDVEAVIHCRGASSADRRGMDQRGLNWTYRDCDFTLFIRNSKTDDIESQSGHFQTMNTLPNGAQIGRSFNEITNSQVTDSNRLSFAQLRAEIVADRAAGDISEARGKEVDLYGKIALPLASVIFGVVGAALGLNTQRGGGRTVGFGMAIFIVFLYWVFYHSMFVVGKNGGLPPIVASFLADVVGALVGLVLTARASR